MEKRIYNLEWRLANLAFDSFAVGFCTSEIPISISGKNYVHVATEIGLLSLFGYFGYRNAKHISDNYHKKPLDFNF